MEEIYRVLEPGGVLLLAVHAGDPLLGLPHVVLFSEEMFDCATQSFSRIEKRLIDDLGCTGRGDYHTWQGVFVKDSKILDVFPGAIGPSLDYRQAIIPPEHKDMT
jgi:SAM-dependent methyltransferase